MKCTKWLLAVPLGIMTLLMCSGISWGDDMSSIVEVQKYSRSIHIMAMLLVGFGFLMVFVKNYGRSAVTATYLLVSMALPLYIFLNGLGIFGESHVSEIDRFILAEFAAASLLICAGAVLGRLKMLQYMILALLFIPCYMLNEWLLLGKGFGLMSQSIVDTGGSIVIHAFGALFGLAVAMTMTTKKEYETEIRSDEVSDRFSLLGSMVLWIFWPSFCSALVAPEQVPSTIVNVVLALCGATLATYFVTTLLRRKISCADIANATLAGGVAIGSTCDFATHSSALVIGIIAGALSVFGFAVLQSRLESLIKKTDTCGVMYLHGLPGLFGGVAAVFVVKGIHTGAQLKGIVIMIGVALITGFITGKIVSMFGRRELAYVDSEEFADVEA